MPKSSKTVLAILGRPGALAASIGTLIHTWQFWFIEHVTSFGGRGGGEGMDF